MIFERKIHNKILQLSALVETYFAVLIGLAMHIGTQDFKICKRNNLKFICI